MTYSVNFFPKNITVKVKEGTDLLEAAYQAGIEIESICGGEGTCGKCKVVVEGEVESPPTGKISEEEREKGYRLACQTLVRGDVNVLVPIEAQVADHKILTSAYLAELEEITPLVNSTYLSLPEPTLEDNVGDLDRVVRGLGFEDGEVTAPLDLLKKMPSTLRGNDWEVTAFLEEYEGEKKLINLCGGDHTSREYGIAVDIGTTTVVLSLTDLQTGEVIAQASDYNKQILCGEDVLTRIAYTEEEGVSRPNRLVLDTINFLISQVASEVRDCEEVEGEIGTWEINSMTVAGNTTMIHLFLGLDPRYIRYEPYIPTVNVPPIFRAGELNLHINPQAPVFILPGRAGYVGGDITAGVLATELYKKSELSLLIDVGTNGEVVLGNEDWMVACSCSAGPAFEGGEVRYGMRAMAGAIDSVKISEDFEVEYTTIQQEKPRGICGSGMIDLLADMLVQGIINKKGQIQDVATDRVRERNDTKEFVIAWGHETSLGEDRIAQMDGEGEIVAEESEGIDIVITENDIANVVRTKGAVYAACRVLLNSVDLRFEDLDHIYIAGGFGNYLDLDKAIVLGLLPDIPKDKFTFIGNGSLAGARLALLSERMREDTKEIFKKMTYFELSTTKMFFDEFSSSLFLPHTEISQFPTVGAILDEKENP